MKRTAPLLLLLVIAGTVIATTITSGDSSSLVKARQLLLKVAKTYQDAPAFTDDILFEITEPRGSISIPLSLALEARRMDSFPMMTGIFTLSMMPFSLRVILFPTSTFAAIWKTVLSRPC